MTTDATPAWLHRRAPTNIKTYPAWASDPTPTADQRPRGYGGLVVTVLVVGVAVMLASWWLK